MIENKTVYVGDLPAVTTEADLFRLFSKCGPISSIKLVHKPSTGYSHAYVNFLESTDADKAVVEMNFAQLFDQQIRVSFFDANKDNLQRFNIIVKNLPPFVDNRGLFDTFSVFGTILSCKVSLDSHGNSKCFGFVCYKDKIAMRKAIALANGTMMDGCLLKVVKFERKEVRVVRVNESFTNVYCKNFLSLGPVNLEKVLKHFGPITSFYLQRGPDDKLTGVAFCNFLEAEAAKKAVQALHGLSCDQIYKKYLQGDEATNDQDAPKGDNRNGKDDMGVDRIGENSENDLTNKKGDSANNSKNEKHDLENNSKNENDTEQITQEGSAVHSNIESQGSEDILDKLKDMNIRQKVTDQEKSDSNFTTLANSLSDEIFYIQRAQTKAERHEQLKEAFRAATLEGKPFKRNLYVVNLPPTCEEKDILSFFNQFGNITNYKLNTDPATNLKFAYICFSTPEEAENALKANDAVFDGHKISIQFFKTKKERAEEKILKTQKNSDQKIDERRIGGDLYGMVLAMAELFQKDWKRMGVENEYAFADRITKLLMDRPFSEVRNMIGLGDILSHNIMEIMKNLDRTR